MGEWLAETEGGMGEEGRELVSRNRSGLEEARDMLVAGAWGLRWGEDGGRGWGAS